MNTQAKEKAAVTDLTQYERQQLQDYPQPMDSTTSLILDPNAMDKMMKLAELMAKSVVTIPKHLQDKPSDCLAIIMQAMQWKMNPYAVAQKTHLVNGTLGYEAQLVNAVIISMAPTKDRPNYEWFGDWDKYIEGGMKKPDEKGLGVRVWATMKGESEPRVVEVMLDPITTRNSPLWKTKPKQQMAYVGVKDWSRLHTPDVIQGVYTPDEMEDFGSREPRDVNPRPGQRATEVIHDYPQKEFDKNLPTWEKKILEGKANTEFIASKVETKGILTEEQRDTLKSIEEKFAQKSNEEEPQS